MKLFNFFSVSVLAGSLAACGGSFGVKDVQGGVEPPLSVEPEITDNKPDEKLPDVPKPVETSVILQPDMGAAVRIPKRNSAVYDESGKRLPDQKQAEELLKIEDGSVLRSDGAGKETPAFFHEQLKAKAPRAYVYDSAKKDGGFDFVRAGYVFTDSGYREVKALPDGKRYVNRSAIDGFVFYRGIRPAQYFLLAKAVYRGNWEFVTDAKRDRGGSDVGYLAYYGDLAGATSYAESADDREKHPSEFEVDFSARTLSGKLFKNQRVKRNEPKSPLLIYEIDAKISGNRFKGSARVNPLLSGSNGHEHLFFNENADNRLEGGFFGDRAEELGGKFLTNSGSVFGVFAAKSGDAENAGYERVLDGVRIATDELANKDARPVAAAPMPTFGNIDKLLIDGKEVPLLPDTGGIASSLETKMENGQTVRATACCNMFDYLRFGKISKSAPVVSAQNHADKGIEEHGEEGGDEEADGEEGNEDEMPSEHENNGGDDAGAVETASQAQLDELEATRSVYGGTDLFVQGVRTREAEMPKTGSAHYLGTWEARVGLPAQWNNRAGDFRQNGMSKAEFDVDFGARSLSGTLTEHNGVEPAFYLENGVIEGNGFSADVRTRENGIDVSGTGSTSPNLLHIEGIRAQGGFYGPNAQELGGAFYSDQYKTGAVFGAKLKAE